MKALCLLCVLVLTGCAQNYIRVTEYDGTTMAIPGFNAAAGGCMVSTKGVVPPGLLLYKGERCTYGSESGPTIQDELLATD